MQVHIKRKVCVGSDLSRMERIKGVNICGGEDRSKIKPVRRLNAEIRFSVRVHIKRKVFGI